MRTICYALSPEGAFLFDDAARTASMAVQFTPSVHEFSSQLYRDHEAIGLIYGEGWTHPVEIAHELREAGILNLLFFVVDLGDMEGGRQATARARILNAGADEVQSLPIETVEIAGRLTALRRRPPVPVNNLIPISSGFFDPQGHKLIKDDLVIHLTGKEAALLELLASHPGSCISKERCMQTLYEQRDEPGNKIIDVFLCKLRKKLVHICGEAMVRTAVSHTTGAAQEALYAANSNVIAKEQWVSTLDTRTCKHCMALDGQTYDIGKGPRRPAHIGCRCVRVPRHQGRADALHRGRWRGRSLPAADR